MARSSTQDPVDKFRFKVSFFEGDQTLTSWDSPGISQSDIIRSGFSDITLPQSRVKEILYRENLDPNKHRKIAGLVTYEPVILRRGVTKNREIYNWYKKVNNDIASLSTANTLVTAFNFPPFLRTDYRRDLLIESLDRSGETVRAWFIFNAFPLAYRGGDGLNAQTNEKLLEELTLTYEAFFELDTDDINQAISESIAAAQDAVASAALSGFSSLFGG